MAASAIFSVLALACVAFLFTAISLVCGSRFAFLAICWLPLAGLMSAVGAHHDLGYAMIGVLAAIVAAGVATVALGVTLCVKAVRENSAIGSLAWGTLIAAAPLLIMAARW